MTDDPIRWLYGLQHFGIKLGLDGIRGLLRALMRPERAVPAILVAGTNGKGSTAAMLEALLLGEGLRTGLFTSPHLVRPQERIRIQGRDVSTADLARHLDTVRRQAARAVEQGGLAAHPSFFEVLTATALEAFRESTVQAAVLEVGMGGRLDATNAVPARVSAIVSIGLDHTERLGPTLAAIAREKAGIVKPGRPLVIGPLDPEPRAVVEEAAAAAGAPLLDASERTSAERDGRRRWRVRTPEADYAGIDLPLAGAHQGDNLRVALLAYEAFLRDLGRRPDPARAVAGLARTRWPGRLQWVAGGPPLLLDGAHNPAGARTLADHLGECHGTPVLLFGAMKDKDLPGLLAPLADRVSTVIVTRPAVERAAEPAAVAEVARRLFRKVEVETDLGDALDRARELTPEGGFVLVSGSLYLVGEVLGLLEGGTPPGPVPL